MSKKDQRILKLHAKGMTIEQIAKKIGCPEDLNRIRQTIPEVETDEKCPVCGSSVGFCQDPYECGAIRGGCPEDV